MFAKHAMWFSSHSVCIISHLKSRNDIWTKTYFYLNKTRPISFRTIFILYRCCKTVTVLLLNWRGSRFGLVRHYFCLIKQRFLYYVLKGIKFTYPSHDCTYQIITALHCIVNFRNCGQTVDTCVFRRVVVAWLTIWTLSSKTAYSFSNFKLQSVEWVIGSCRQPVALIAFRWPEGSRLCKWFCNTKGGTLEWLLIYGV